MVVVTDDGLMVTWDPVTGNVTGYEVLIERVDRRDTLNLATDVSTYTITSQLVGGYERVEIRVVAVNSEGSGPASASISSRTPSIGQPPYLTLSLDLYISFLPPSSGACDGGSIRRRRSAECVVGEARLPQWYTD